MYPQPAPTAWVPSERMVTAERVPLSLFITYAVEFAKSIPDGDFPTATDSSTVFVRALMTNTESRSSAVSWFLRLLGDRLLDATVVLHK
jgi:hypothetical protein